MSDSLLKRNPFCIYKYVKSIQLQELIEQTSHEIVRILQKFEKNYIQKFSSR
jgi:hypothetical protein